jgi:hypothetical protein
MDSAMPERLLSALDRAVSIARESLDNEGLAWLAAEPWEKVAALRRRGPDPAISPAPPVPVRPISIVAVRYDALCDSNLLASPDLHHPALQFHLVDDRHGMRVGSLARALIAGLQRWEVQATPGAVVAFVSQDCFLPDGWLAAVEASLRSLESHDEHWGVAGVAGVDESGRPVGRVSEPWGLLDTFRGGARWAAASSLADHVLLLPTERLLSPDADLPGFEGLGASLCQGARAAGRRSYVIDAPVIVERVGHDGRPVTRAIESRRVRGQLYRQQRVQREITLEYLAGPGAFRDASTLTAPFRLTCNPLAGAKTAPPPEPAPDIAAALDRPLVLLGKGGGGSRLVSVLAEDCGVFVGRVNISGDCLDMVPAVYAGVLRVHDCTAPWQRDRAVESLREGAAAMLKRGWESGTPWGFKVPESLLLLPQIAAAFPNARFLFLARDPVSTCLRRSHITAQLDNPIGRVSLTAAYRAANLPTDVALTEPIEVRSARVTLHQVGTSFEYLRTRIPAHRRMEIRFDDLVGRPAETRAAVARWLGLDVLCQQLERDVDGARAGYRSSTPPDTVADVERILAPLTAALGYEPAPKRSSRG